MLEMALIENIQREDLIYVTKKLGLTPGQFEEIMRAPRRSFRDFRNSYALVQFLRRTVNRLRKRGMYPK